MIAVHPARGQAAAVPVSGVTVTETATSSTACNRLLYNALYCPQYVTIYTGFGGDCLRTPGGPDEGGVAAVFRSPGVQATRCQTATTPNTTAITPRAMVLAVRMRLPVVLGWVGRRDQQLFRDPARPVGPSSRFGRYIGQPLLGRAAPATRGWIWQHPALCCRGRGIVFDCESTYSQISPLGRISTLEWLSSGVVVRQRRSMTVNKTARRERATVGGRG